MFFKVISLLLLLASSGLTSAFASKLNIALDPKDMSKMPASDLVYNGARIDELEAFELKKAGVDISKLNPYESSLWQNNKYSISNQNELGYSKAPTLKFINFKNSPREIFRAKVVDKKSAKQFVITASLDNHTNILRAALLRLLGFNLDTPKFYKKMKIEFKNEKQKKKFIELVGEETLTKREKWVLRDISKTKLLIKGFTIEPAELKNVNIHLPVMARARQVDRRIFRSLIAIYSLTDFTQKINSIAWKVGKSFNNTFSLNHPYASDFKNTTYDDMRWILLRLNTLSKNELRESLKLSSYPNDILELLLEKLVSRIKSISKYFEVESTYQVNTLITNGNVAAGSLIGGNYSDYVVEFYEKDPENPYRFSEIFRLFRTQILYSSLSGLLDTALTSVIPGVNNTEAAESIQTQIQDYRQENPAQNGVLPLSSFSSPLASGKVFATRNIVFGQYLDSTAPIQLVDSIGAQVSLGVFTSIAGLAQSIMPNIVADVSYARTYSHVRAMPDLKTASNQKVKRIFVPGLMKSLGRIIKDEYECSISKKPYSEESVLSGSQIYYVKYDPKFDNAKEDALKLRQELIDNGTPAGKILLIVIDREKLCKDEIAQTRTNSLKKFLKKFALNETFIINDSLRLSGNINAPVPITFAPGVSLSLGSENSISGLKSVIMKRTSDGMDITIASQRDRRHGHKEGLNYFLEIMSHSSSFTRGNLISNLYKIKLDGIDSEEEIKAMRALRQFLVSNKHTLLKESYKPTKLNHDVWSRLRTFRLLWFRSEKVKQDHTVNILIPNKEGQNFTQKERTRKLYSTFIVKRKGSDFQSFTDRVLGTFYSWLSIGSSNGDPGQTFLGSGKKVSITTEGELTEGFPLEPITRVEYTWTGWRKKTHKLEKIFAEIEEPFKRLIKTDLIDRSKFFQSSILRSYSIKNTILLYPKAFDKIKKFILEPKEIIAINALRNMYGIKKWDEYCKRSTEFHGEIGPQNYFGERTYRCVPVSVKKILRLRKNFPQEKKQKAKAINLLYNNLFKNFDKATLMEWIGVENFFSSSRITGFRQDHHEGFLEYISDTVGTYDQEQGTGVFDRLGGFLGISPFELRALSYTPGL